MLLNGSSVIQKDKMLLDDIFNSINEQMDGFPETDYRFTTMQDYIDELSEFLELVYGQKTLRLRARIKAENNEEKEWDLKYELQQLEEHGLVEGFIKTFTNKRCMP
jgi:hypothetical protein